MQRHGARQLLGRVLRMAEALARHPRLRDACAGRRPCRTAAAGSGGRTATSRARPARGRAASRYSGTTRAQDLELDAAQKRCLSSSVKPRPFATSARMRSSRSKYSGSIQTSLCQTCRSRRSSVENCAASARGLSPLPLLPREPKLRVPRDTGRSSAARGRGRSSRRRTRARRRSAHRPASARARDGGPRLVPRKRLELHQQRRHQVERDPHLRETRAAARPCPSSP